MIARAVVIAVGVWFGALSGGTTDRAVIGDIEVLEVSAPPTGDGYPVVLHLLDERRADDEASRRLTTAFTEAGHVVVVVAVPAEPPSSDRWGDAVTGMIQWMKGRADFRGDPMQVQLFADDTTGAECIVHYVTERISASTPRELAEVKRAVLYRVPAFESTGLDRIRLGDLYPEFLLVASGSELDVRERKWVTRFRSVGARVKTIALDGPPTLTSALEFLTASPSQEPSAVFERTVDGDDVHYRVPRVRTPAWDRRAAIARTPIVVRRILRCGKCVLDRESNELRFTTRGVIDDQLPARLDAVAQACGLVPYYSELQRRAELGEVPTWKPVWTATVPGVRPVLLGIDRVETESGVVFDLRVHVAGDGDLLPISPAPVAGETRTYRLSAESNATDRRNWQLSEVARVPFDPAAERPEHAANPTEIRTASRALLRADPLTNHCLANDRYTLRYSVHGRTLVADSDHLFGHFRLREIRLDSDALLGEPFLLAFREDQGEGAIIVWSLEHNL